MQKNTHDLSPLCGRFAVLREIALEDAAFVFELRTTGKGARFLHTTDGGVAEQAAYIRRYLTLDYEWYFVVEDLSGERVGLISLYDVDGDTVRKGRWVMKDGADRRCGIESDVMIKRFAFETLGCSAVKTDTRHRNKNMQAFFRAWGCVEERRDAEEIYYTLSREDFYAHLPVIERFYDETPAAVAGSCDGHGGGKLHMQYAEVFANALELSPAEAEAAAYGDVPSWDSVGHIALASALEKAFGVVFTPQELAQFRTFEDGKALLRDKGVEI